MCFCSFSFRLSPSARRELSSWPKASTPSRAQDGLKQGKVKPEYLEGKKVEMAMPAITFDDKITLNLGAT